MIHKYILAVLLIINMYACNLASNQEDATTQKNIENKKDLLAGHIDTSIHPGNDFFEYANGVWIKANPIPDAENGWGIFNLVDNENYTRLKRISEDATSMNAPKGSPSQLIGDFFSAGMDSASIEKNGILPLQNELTQIDHLTTKEEVVQLLHHLQQIGVSAAYNISVYQDMKNSNSNMVYLTQGGLGLPDRDYYFNNDSTTVKNKSKYIQYVAKINTLLGIDSTKANANANSVLKLETYLASAHKKLAEMRDPYANYNKMNTAQVLALCPTLNFKQAFSSFSITKDSIIVGQPLFFQQLEKALQTFSISDWKNYIRFHLVSTFASTLNTAMDKEYFNFYNATLNGTKEQRPRWKRVLEAQEGALGDALGQLFIKEYFTDKQKKRYDNMVVAVMQTYKEHIQKLDWMTDSTKSKAIHKLEKITRKVGYPDTWKDYSTMPITRESYCKNVMASNQWHFNYNIQKLNKPVDRTEWDMTPQTYNAYYNPSNNEIVLPAAMLTAPGYSDNELDDALVYGYVGASTIGHELTHAFDDEGRQFDAEGNLKNWWTKEDEQKFKLRAAMLVKQFNGYTILNNLHPNGEASLGENIADLGGVIIGYDAFKKTKQYQENKLIGGLTPSQRFFLGYAYGWMQVRRPQMVAKQILTDVHAPIMLRVNGPMSNSDAWYQTFNVTKEHTMYRDSIDRVRIW